MKIDNKEMMNNKKNIMLISQRLIGGGAERVIVELASMLSLSYNVYLVAHDTSVSYRLSDSPSQPFTICSLDIPSSSNKKEKLINLIKSVKRLKALKKEYNIFCSISMLTSPNLENVLSRVHDKVVISIRNKCSIQNPKGTYKYWISYYAGQKADKVITLSKSVFVDQRDYFKTPDRNINTIYNPCNVKMIKERISEDSDQYKNFKKIRDNYNFIAITAGRLVAQKGHWHLIKSFRKVVNENENAALIILGKGELEVELLKLIDDLNLNNNVFILGFTENPYPLFAESDLFVFSSLYEGFGNVLLEAMACNLPIVSSDCDAGPRELLAPSSDMGYRTKDIDLAEFGILTKPFAVNDIEITKEEKIEEYYLSEAIIKMMSDSILSIHYRKQSEKRIEDFSPDIIQKEWEKIIEE